MATACLDDATPATTPPAWPRLAEPADPELARLVAQQAREIERERHGNFGGHRRKWESLEADIRPEGRGLGTALDRIEARPADSPEWRAWRAEADRKRKRPRERGLPPMLEGEGYWLWHPAEAAGFTPRKGPCPACHGEPAGVCLICSGDPGDPRPHPMQDRRKGRAWDGSAADAADALDLAGGMGRMAARVLARKPAKAAPKAIKAKGKGMPKAEAGPFATLDQIRRERRGRG